MDWAVSWDLYKRLQSIFQVRKWKLNTPFCRKWNSGSNGMSPEFCKENFLFRKLKIRFLKSLKPWFWYWNSIFLQKKRHIRNQHKKLHLVMYSDISFSKKDGTARLPYFVLISHTSLHFLKVYRVCVLEYLSLAIRCFYLILGA